MILAKNQTNSLIKKDEPKPVFFTSGQNDEVLKSQ